MFSWCSLCFPPLLKECEPWDVWSGGLGTSDGPTRGWRESGTSGKTGETERGEWWTCWRSRSAVTFFWTGIHAPLVSFSHLLLHRVNTPPIIVLTKKNCFNICFYSVCLLQEKSRRQQQDSRNFSLKMVRILLPFLDRWVFPGFRISKILVLDVSVTPVSLTSQPQLRLY